MDLQPPFIETDSDDLAEMLRISVRAHGYTYPPLAATNAEARRLVKSGGARVIDREPKILARPPDPPASDARHRFWVQVGKMRLIRVFWPPTG